VGDYIRNYKSKGLPSLVMKHSTGARRKLSKDQEEFNLIEGLWGWLKSRVINNAFYPTLSRVRVAVQNFIAHINKVPTEIIDRLCIRM
jgi:hypothetical protein